MFLGDCIRNCLHYLQRSYFYKHKIQEVVVIFRLCMTNNQNIWDHCKLGSQNHIFDILCSLRLYHHKNQRQDNHIFQYYSMSFLFEEDYYHMLDIYFPMNKSYNHIDKVCKHLIYSINNAFWHKHTTQISNQLLSIALSHTFNNRYYQVFSWYCSFLDISLHKTYHHRYMGYLYSHHKQIFVSFIRLEMCSLKKNIWYSFRHQK